MTKPVRKFSRKPAELRARACEIDRRLAAAYPGARCALHHGNALELLVATILSAQCTDARVNIVTKELFGKYRTAAEYAAATQSEMEEMVRTTGFFRNKAKHIRESCRAIVEEFGGELPRTMEQLLRLPGVARKTANVVLGTAFGVATGVVVDTHVQRISRLLGLTSQTDPAKIEAELMALIPQSEWIGFSHRTILHGRQCCVARRPDCARCPVESLCPGSRESRVKSQE